MNIRARFRLDRGDFRLRVELNVPGHGITGILGPSGSGKTSLLRAMAGLEICDDGFLAVRQEIWQDGQRFLPPHQRPIGYVFQEASLFAHLDVKRNLQYGFRRTPQDRRKISWTQAVKLLGLGPLLKRPSEHLSGGERQRVAIARALLTSPRLLLMDEPLAALDLASKREILPFLERLHEELDLPIFYVSHSSAEVARLADHLVLMQDGRVQASGPIEEMLTRLDLPLASGEDAESILSATVVSREEDFQLTHLKFAGGMLQVPGIDLPIGKSVRLGILARDVSLTLEQQTGTSILNILPAWIEELVPEGSSRTLVRLQIGDKRLLSRITRKSAASLDLESGKKVFVQIKSVAVLA